jgi:hypothetical protein
MSGVFTVGEMNRFAAIIFLCLVSCCLSPAISAEFYSTRYGIYLVGEITSGDYDRFVSVLKQRGVNVFRLEVRSGGGNVLEAIRIGRLLRQLMGVVGGPNAPGVPPHCSLEQNEIGKPAPCICASACTLIFFGGAFRQGSDIYLHSIAFEKNMFGSLGATDASRLYKAAMTEIRSYLSEMEIDEKYYYMMSETASSQLVRVPLGQDLLDFPPSIREWMQAKCGPAAAPGYATCTNDAIIAEQLSGIRKLLNVEAVR